MKANLRHLYFIIIPLIVLVSGFETYAQTNVSVSDATQKCVENGGDIQTWVLNISNSGTTITAGTVEIDFDAYHSYKGDLTITLQSPTGTLKTIKSNGNGGTNELGTPDGSTYGSPALYTIKDGTGNGNVDVSSDSPPGSYDPVGAFSGFDGEDPQGNWTLTMIDGAGGDDGCIRNVELRMTITSPNDQTSTIDAGAFSEPTSINSISNDTDPERLALFDFSFQDLGSGDALNTIIDAIKISQGSVNTISDWTDVIAGAKLTGTDLGTLTGVVNATEITFSNTGLLTMIDGGAAKTCTLEIWLNSTLVGNTIDNDLLEFAIVNTNITTDAAGSSFQVDSEESGNAGVAIDIDATALGFSAAPPASQLINADFSATVKAQDANGNIDTDASGTVTMSEAGTGTMSSILDPDLTNSFTNGLVAWTDFQYDTQESGVVLTASHSGVYSAVNNGIGTNFINAVILTVCPSSCDYTNIQAAYNFIETQAPISTAYIIELQSSYTDASEPTAGIDFDDVVGASASNTVTIRPAADVASILKISFDPTNVYGGSSITTAYLIEFDAADYITIDGRPGGVGTNKFITIENEANPSSDDAGAAIVFTDDAQNNTIQFCNVYAETEYNISTEVGIIHIHRDNSTDVLGNDDITIDNCIIGDRPSGTSAEPWSGVVFKSEQTSADDCNITNCEFKNVIGNNFSSTGTTATQDMANIYIRGAVANLTITGNSFYSDVAYDIDYNFDNGFIVCESGYACSGFTISNNYFGSDAALGVGTDQSINGDCNSFSVIRINATSVTGTNTISNNTITQLTKYDDANFFPIYVDKRSTSTFNITGNTMSVIDQSGLGDFTAFWIGDGANGAVMNISSNTIDEINLYGEILGTSVKGNSGDPTYNMIQSDNDDPTDLLISSNTFTDLYYDTDIISGSFFTLDNINEVDILNNSFGDAAVNHDINIHVDAQFDLIDLKSDLSDVSPCTYTITGNTFQEIWWSIDNFNDGITNNYNGGSVLYNGSTDGKIILIATDNIFKEFEYGVGSGDYPGHMKGITVEENVSTATINHNEFYNWHNATTYNSGVFNRMLAIQVYGTSNITKNLIYGFTNDQPWGTASTHGTWFQGIEVENGATDCNVYNNAIIFENSGTNGAYGIINGGDNTDVYQNTVKLYGAVSGAETPDNLCYHNNSDANSAGNFINNNIQNVVTGGTGYRRCVDFDNGMTIINYNAYDYSDEIGWASGVSAPRGWTEWQAAGYDANGINESVTMDATGYATSVSWGGQDAGDDILTTVALDRNSTARDITPWIGAYESSAVLPVEMIYFNAFENGESTLLNWETATEINNDYFLIERSNDGVKFIEIGIQNGSGTTSLYTKYEIVDPSPNKGINYYRLKQVDYDGGYSYSNTVDVHFKQEHNFVLYPVPANNILNVIYQGVGDIYIRDITGRVIFSESINSEKTILSLDKLSKAVYFLEIVNKDGKKVQKFVKN